MPKGYYDSSFTDADSVTYPNGKRTENRHAFSLVPYSLRQLKRHNTPEARATIEIKFYFFEWKMKIQSKEVEAGTKTGYRIWKPARLVIWNKKNSTE